jgi:tetratricopeptide (TPR) repeat protein
MRHAAEGAPFGAALLVAAVLAALFIMFAGKKRRPLLFAAGFYILALLPLVFVVRYFSVFAEHWVYMPSYGVFLFVSILVAGLALSTVRLYRVLAMVLVFSGMFLYASSTIAQNSSWMSNSALSDRLLAFSGRDQAAIHFKAVSLLGEKGSEEKIGELMRTYTGLEPEDPRTWYIKGRIELASGDVKKAVSDFNKALQLDPSYDKGYLGLAFSALAEENVVEGIKYLEKAVGLNPKNTEALVFLTTAYSKTGDEAKALLAAKDAKKTNPYDYNVIVNLGTAYARCGDVREAARQYLEASRLYPEKAMPCYNLAYIFYENGQKDTALSYVREALEREPDFKPALELLHNMRAGNAGSKPTLK